MCGDNKHGCGCFESDSAFNTDDRISDVHIASYGIGSGERFEVLDRSDFIVVCFSIDPGDFTFDEIERDSLALSSCHL